jgi:hypothetical protein
VDGLIDEDDVEAIAERVYRTALEEFCFSGTSRSGFCVLGDIWRDSRLACKSTPVGNPRARCPCLFELVCCDIRAGGDMIGDFVSRTLFVSILTVVILSELGAGVGNPVFVT